MRPPLSPPAPPSSPNPPPWPPPTVARPRAGAVDRDLRAGLPAPRARLPRRGAAAGRRARQALLRRRLRLPRGPSRVQLRAAADPDEPRGVPRHARGGVAAVVGRGG